jgi:hypothetical protein
MQQYNYDEVYGDIMCSHTSQPHRHRREDNCRSLHQPIHRHQQGPHQRRPQRQTFQTPSHSPQQSYRQVQQRQRRQFNPQQQTNPQTNPHIQHLDMSLGFNTRSKKSETSIPSLESNYTHPNHKQNSFDPFHGERSDSDMRVMDSRMIRNQNMSKYQMDPRRVANEMNQNAQHMFNGHNQQMIDNPYSEFSEGMNLKPTFYDQNQYSGLSPDRMFLAEAKDISDQRMVSGNPGFNEYMQDTDVNQMMPEGLIENQNEFKQKRSYRDSNMDAESNNKLWEYQFAPMPSE